MAIKFITNQSLRREGKATFRKGDDVSQLALVRDLMALPGMQQVYLFQNTATLTHDGTLEAEDLKEKVSAIMQTRIPVHDADFPFEESPKSRVSDPVDRSQLSEERKKIEQVLDRTVRPGLQSDGGDVEVISYEDNTLRILYQGACGGCPSATMGTLDAIQNILRHELDNESLHVVPI
jgi:Fe-S cluster biogenesis protein NfuA